MAAGPQVSNPHLNRSSEHYGAPLDSARVVVYAVHGRGQDTDFMAGLAERIDRPDVGFVLAAAADSTWYPHPFMSDVEMNEPSLGHALDTVTAHLDDLAAGGVEPSRTVVLGFSQGACLLAEHLLTRPRRHGAAVLHTGGYMGPIVRDHHAAGALAGLDVLMDTSRQDVAVPLTRVLETRDALTTVGAHVDLRVYDDEEHHVDDASIARIRVLLDQFPPHHRGSPAPSESSIEGEAR